MIKEKIRLVIFSSAIVVCLGLNVAHASEVTGNLSANAHASSVSGGTNGTLSGNVSGGSEVTGNLAANSTGGSSGSNVSSGGGSSGFFGTVVGGQDSSGGGSGGGGGSPSFQEGNQPGIPNTGASSASLAQADYGASYVPPSSSGDNSGLTASAGNGVNSNGIMIIALIIAGIGVIWAISYYFVGNKRTMS